MILKLVFYSCSTGVEKYKNHVIQGFGTLPNANLGGARYTHTEVMLLE
jgi:hypothetical protein